MVVPHVLLIIVYLAVTMSCREDWVVASSDSVTPAVGHGGMVDGTIFATSQRRMDGMRTTHHGNGLNHEQTIPIHIGTMVQSNIRFGQTHHFYIPLKSGASALQSQHQRIYLDLEICTSPYFKAHEQGIPIGDMSEESERYVKQVQQLSSPRPLSLFLSDMDPMPNHTNHVLSATTDDMRRDAGIASVQWSIHADQEPNVPSGIYVAVMAPTLESHHQNHHHRDFQYQLSISPEGN